jgi:CBS domain-containing protein
MTPKQPQQHNVVWTRGNGCFELASLLAEGEAYRVDGDLVDSCIDNRADFVVAKKMPGSFDLANVAVPVDFDIERIGRVSATVAGGPHSQLAAATAHHIATKLGVPFEIVSAHQEPSDIRSAISVVAQFGAMFPTAERRVVQARDMNELAETADDDALIVVGAPGGAWLRRNRFGRGARIKGAAPAGAVMVRLAPDRVYRFMSDPVYVAPLLQAMDTLRLHPQKVLAVAERGRLVGVVRRETLVEGGNQTVASVMEKPVSAKVDETLEEAMVLEETFGEDPIPVTDHSENLVGGLSLPAA